MDEAEAFFVLFVCPQLGYRPGEVERVKEELACRGCVVHNQKAVALRAQHAEYFRKVCGFERLPPRFLLGESLVMVVGGEGDAVGEKDIASALGRLFSEGKLMLNVGVEGCVKCCVMLELSFPRKKPIFVEDKLLLNARQMLDFVAPPNTAHPNIAANLDILAIFGPSLASHDVYRCFCDSCSRSIRSALPHGGVPSHIVALKQLHPLLSGFCGRCQAHAMTATHILSGKKENCVATESELAGALRHENRREVSSLLMKANKNYNLALLTEIVLEKMRFNYTRAFVKELLAALPLDSFDRFGFGDFQKIIFEDRKLRLGHFVSELLTLPLPQVLRFCELDPATLAGRSLPLDLHHKEMQKRTAVTFTPVLPANGDRFSQLQQRFVLDKLMNRFSHQVFDPIRAEKKKVDLTNYLLFLKEFLAQRAPK